MLSQQLNHKILVAIQFLNLYLMLSAALIIPCYASQPDHNNVNHKTSENITHKDVDSIKISMQISLDQLAKDYPDALELIYVLSMFDSKNIPHSYIKKWLELNHKKGSASKVLKPIIDLSLIDVATDAKSDKQSYALHDLVHKTIHESIPLQDKTRIIDQATQIMLAMMSDRLDLMIQMMINEPIHLQHAVQIIDTANQSKYVNKDLLLLKAKIFEFYMGGLRDCNKATVMINDIKSILSNTNLKLDLYDQAIFNVYLEYYTALNDQKYQDENNLLFESYDIIKKFKGFYEEKLLILTNLAQIYVIIGQNNQAKYWLEQASQNFHHSQSQVYNIFYLSICSSLSLSEANYADCQKFVSQAKEVLPAITAYPNVQFGILDHEIELLLKTKNYFEAKVCNDIMYQKLNIFYQDRENSYLARNILYRGWISLEMNHDYVLASEKINKSIEMSNRIFHGSDMHILQGLQHMILGRTLEGQQKYAEALAEYQFAERIYKKILEQLNGMDDVSVLYQHLMQISLKLDQLKQAKQYLKTHIKLFGSDHLRTKAMQALISK